MSNTIKVGTAIAHKTIVDTNLLRFGDRAELHKANGDVISTRYEFIQCETTRSWKKAWEITEEFCGGSRDEWQKVKTVCGDMLLVCVIREVIA